METWPGTAPPGSATFAIPRRPGAVRGFARRRDGSVTQLCRWVAAGGPGEGVASGIAGRTVPGCVGKSLWRLPPFVPAPRILILLTAKLPSPCRARACRKAGVGEHAGSSDCCAVAQEVSALRGGVRPGPGGSRRMQQPARPPPAPGVAGRFFVVLVWVCRFIRPFGIWRVSGTG